jgi:hypothetical protein
MSQDLTGMVSVTVHPDHVAKPVLETVDVAVCLGEDPADAIGRFCHALNLPVPLGEFGALDPGDGVFWDRKSNEQPYRLHIAPCEADRRRHRRKYAEGELPADRSFFFRGPEDRLNLRAHNLFQFMELGEGLDDQTWLHHLQRGDYSTWMSEGIKDPTLADRVRQIEQQPFIDANRSRQLIRSAVEDRYTVPATGL